MYRYVHCSCLNLRLVIFVVFAVNLLSVKFSSAKLIGEIWVVVIGEQDACEQMFNNCEQ